MIGQIDIELTMREAMERAETSARVIYLTGLMNRYRNVAQASRHADVERSNFRRLLKRYKIEYQSGHVSKEDEADEDDE